ncbi:hypothetical protein E2C01_086796 [Portunus trituberculatus]|uniref:Uncharacterized protein n=1 Tax=Portunus trituberculatus TaxID=210409 RepID=A0A5B7JA92_PORTR|nr:hypothetical protein [Portunus trituberculatus]
MVLAIKRTSRLSRLLFRRLSHSHHR